MLTAEQIWIYKKYDGDADSFARLGSVKEKRIMDDDAWSIIDGVSQDLEMDANGFTSQEYSAQLKRKLQEQVIDKNVLKEIETLVKRN